MGFSAIFLAPPVAKATALTGAGVTRPAIRAPPTGARFINNGEGAGTRININLLPGSYPFHIFAEPGTGTSFERNLFCDGNGNTPGISAFGPVNTSSFGPNPETMRQLNGVSVAGANTDTFIDGSTTVAVTGFSFASPVTQDQVSAFKNVHNQVSDFTGSFSLQVSGPQGATPETAYMVLPGGRAGWSIGCFPASAPRLD